MELRVLNDKGIGAFAGWIADLRVNPTLEPPVSLLTADDSSQPMDGQVEVAQVAFPSKLEAVRYLDERLGGVPPELIARGRGLWSWLTLFYIDQVLPARRSDGGRAPKQMAKYIPSEHGFREYRHLLQGPFKLYKVHGGRARLLLAKPLHVWSDLEEQLIALQELIRTRGAMEAADLLYFDETRGESKRGAANYNRPGTVRRFGAIVQQLSLTYDLHSMDGHAILSLLPSEFDRFRLQLVDR